MEEVLISGMVNLLQQPGLVPDDMEQEGQKLLNLLMAIQPFLSDAHLRAKPGPWLWARDEGDIEVSTWLDDLKEVAYHADDILDGFRYVKLHAQTQAGEKVRTHLLSCSKVGDMTLSYFMPRVSRREQGVGNTIGCVVNKINKLVKRMRTFNFLECQGIITDIERQKQLNFSTSTEIDPIVVGRDEETEEIVRFLLDPLNTISETIISILILGPREIGKGLTRYVCKDARINDHFQCILWVDVVPEFQIGTIAKSIIDQVIGKDCCLSEDDIDLLKLRINQELTGKRYLLVYDDVGTTKKKLSNDIGGDKKLLVELKSWLESGVGSGSSLIALTERVEFAENMCFSHVYELPEVANDLWILFCKSTFSDSNETHPDILEMGRKIVHICGGSRLSVNLMGGLMRFKKEPGEWKEVIDQLENLIRLKNEREWQRRETFDNNDTYEIAKLCYNYMSSESKQYFLFCSLFPFGYYIEKEVLIKLWMANSLFSSDGSTSLEEKGDSIFNELALRHFFEDVKLVHGDGDLYMNKQGYLNRVVCKMARKIYALCQDAARCEGIYNLEDRFQEICWPRTSQVCFLSTGDYSPIDLNKVLKHFQRVRTFMSTGDPFVRTVKCNGLPKSNSLRALHLRSSLFEGDLFETVEHMKHLRYLDLSGSRIKILPESACLLYNLQTLNLSKCLLLYQLPANMRYMRSLRHLYVHQCPKLKRMPPHLGKLIHLQTLSAYIVGERPGNGIDEIRNLNLGDSLELYNLRKVKNAAGAKEANLVSKTKLKILTLSWGSNQVIMANKSNDLEVFETLEPHSGLKVLKVQQYGDPRFATWLTNPVGLQSLVELHLIGCSQCKILPAVWRLPSLQVLCLKHMVSLTCVCSFSCIGNVDSLGPFPSLTRLELVDLKRLERWQEEETSSQRILTFPLVCEIEITKCPNLGTMPNVPLLKHFIGSIENHRQLWSVIALVGQSKSLVEANITKASNDVTEPVSVGVDVKFDDSHKLRIMRLDSTDIFFMPRLLPRSLMIFWTSLISLENLNICNCNSLVDWPLEEFKSLNKLKRLSFRMCPNLTGLFPNQLLQGEELLPQLETLEFYRCVSLKEVPKCYSILNLELDECPEVHSISGITNLEMLYLSCTSWMSLPTGLGDLKKLQSLRVSECYSLTRLPKELANLTSLRTLTINKCPRLRSLPNGLHEMLSGLSKFQTLECPYLETFCKEGPYSSIISHFYIKENDSYQEMVEETIFALKNRLLRKEPAPDSENEEEDA
ncbi:Disease resistance protein RGA2 [Rhynchospora pubera]|uniref:Disease resistance protein RGA2 n=1 Tax=Rhynchospora pubera TaxID=906938 RepID=A0AAV8HY22_9POAL|nr:Disease resistance protein RGA2 [Rhynchospora pubera]